MTEAEAIDLKERIVVCGAFEPAQRDYLLRLVNEDMDRQKGEHKLVEPIRNNTCPDCKTEGLIPGPTGGASMNVMCGVCGSKFNAHGANLWDRRSLRNTFSVERI